MTSHDPRSVSVPSTPAPDLGFKAGFGFYLGVIVAGLTAIGGIVVDAATATILATAPSTLTAVLLLVFIFGHRLRGLPERIGQSRRRRLACYLPAVAFAAVAVFPAVTSLESTARLGTLAIALSLLSGAVAVGVARMARNRYVAAMTPDEPVTTWTYHHAGYWTSEWVATGGMALLVVSGLALAWNGSWIGLLWAGYGLVFVLTSRFGWFDTWYDIDPSDRWNAPSIRAHAAGLVLEQSFATKLVPWAAITDISLTDDELVLERRWRDIRCDRAAIDDPEAVLEGIKRARDGREPSTDARVARTDNTK
ncbi:PH domain-containing protein [Natronorubrum bangense]|uniref:Low molecular weight protein antigen 6 PH domain-containing protein n=2 Tax=Natronorubrum bangense TaxID=61858 RepID=L9WF38_9EURY|nr:PH domain-containing protein [Natronorubrum bangense]ELY47896.1 hypothetical protein C494_11870 [Natronorubrum bangense JCM 10635]QCC53637.1 PH domain-containing protein [Natronorubrum bangense]